jgi:Putative prokaryotic signal transducing protein
MNRWVTTAGNEIEADIIVGRLTDAGIHAWASSLLATGMSLNHPYDIYVDDADLDAAKRVLVETKDTDEGELARLAEEAVPPPD